ncbi:probable ubiquitin-like-specific protease 2A isoform X1 [Punica granatum]|uniref:Probable ubiquitin-like-specific protease 2A isoform X1 n=1 Tax=Punica granatum TaxID=22663 RepID=A0A6P8EEW0_PUNGR|nr:probable ubiquitin-like-specific protease 2A isoform X1 [Punica granatum]XP_031403942.1 probable ubiquitin-like-specific protease 2A isoform X1 [Punica granatum]XP_031403944.1 probable ubiquitin-like-specific protease 2A isoform X1 [Punica granatum]
MSKRKSTAVIECSTISLDGSGSGSGSVSVSVSVSDSELATDAFSQHEGPSSGTACDAAVALQSKKLSTSMFEHYLGIMQKNFSKDTKASFAFLDSLWFSVYRQKSSKDKVLEWIKKKRILSKKYVVVPIVCWNHWNLLILCHLGESKESKTRTRCMLLLDSLHMAEPKRLEPDIRRFVSDIYEVEKKPQKTAMFSKIPLLVPKVPQQRNGEHCGLYVLYFLNLFVQHAPKNFSIEDGYPYFMTEDWFCHEDVDRFCSELTQRNQ